MPHTADDPPGRDPGNLEPSILVPVVTGPTSVGKTAISIMLAQRLGGEILSADSRQIFRGFDIGTAKPSPDELSRVRHHLIDERDPGDSYSAGIFARLAEQRISEIVSRGSRPIVTGGSTLYLRALTEGLADIPRVAESIRETLNERLAHEGAGALYRELLARDPLFAATLDETKTQRIVRGLEVAIGTGRPLSAFFEDALTPAHRYRLFVLTRDRKRLYARIDKRVDRMMSAGLLAELEMLRDTARGSASELLTAIGYRELMDHLDGRTSLEASVALIKRNTRRYAKRQLTWFRRCEEAIWYDLDEWTPEAICEAIQDALEKNETQPPGPVTS